MSGAFKAVGDIAGGIVGGLTKPIAGAVKGAGQILTGHPIEGLSTAVGGVVQGSASVVKGGLGAVKNVAGDPLLMGAAGLATGGLAGVVVAPMLGNLASGIAGGAENKVSQTFHLDGQQQMASQYNDANFGSQNAYMGGGNVGQPAPYGQGGMPPQYGAAPGATGFC